MTVLLVLFLFLAFVATDQVVRAASRRLEARREEAHREAVARSEMSFETEGPQAAPAGRAQDTSLAADLHRRPGLRLVTPMAKEADGTADEFRLPGGAFISSGHAWVRIEASGEVRIGIDDFAQKAAGDVGRVTLPRKGQEIRMGEPLFSLKRGGQELHFTAPVSGRVVEGNTDLVDDAIRNSPYQEGWICRIRPTDLAAELATMRIGPPAVQWYDQEIHRLEDLRASKKEVNWADLESEFLVGSH